MIGDILERHRLRPDMRGANENKNAEETEIDDLGCFGFLRGSRELARSVELRKRDGTIVAMPYGWLEDAEFNGSDLITLHFPKRDVRIKGRNLNGQSRPNIRLFEALARHRVPWLREASEPDRMTASEGVTVIESIEW